MHKKGTGKAFVAAIREAAAAAKAGGGSEHDSPFSGGSGSKRRKTDVVDAKAAKAALVQPTLEGAAKGAARGPTSVAAKAKVRHPLHRCQRRSGNRQLSS
eukprot:SAG11_NODE_4224_length_2003_cov_2.578782_2_plen_100_part_00